MDLFGNSFRQICTETWVIGPIEITDGFVLIQIGAAVKAFYCIPQVRQNFSSSQASPGGSQAFSFHCASLPLLVTLPVFHKGCTGKQEDLCPDCSGLTPSFPEVRGFCFKKIANHIQSSLSRAALSLSVFGPVTPGWIPDKKPLDKAHGHILERERWLRSLCLFGR